MGEIVAMLAFLSALPSLQDFFPPTHNAYAFMYHTFKYFGLSGLITAAFPQIQLMGKTSSKSSRFNVPGRYAWTIAEIVGPIWVSYIVWTLPSHIQPTPASPSSFLGTGLPLWSEVLYLLYMVHYLNRAIICPWFLSPSMSPIHLYLVVAMAAFQLLNSVSIGSWLVYSSTATSAQNIAISFTPTPRNLFSLILPLLGVNIFAFGLYGNIRSETTLFQLRHEAARRRAKSEGKPFITYDKVYVIPPKEISWFRWMLFPHYTAEWVEWFGYWLIGLGAGMKSGLGKDGGSTWLTPAFWFVIAEILVMIPRARSGRKWYEDKFGKRAVAGRGSISPWSWL